MSCRQHGWNLLDTCKKNSCACVNLAEGTYVSVMGDSCQTSSTSPFVLQIYDNGTFACQAVNPIVNSSFPTGSTEFVNNFTGNWACCSGIWVGVAVQPCTLPLLQCDGNIAAHYLRLTIEICPRSLQVKYRFVTLAVKATDCISDVPPELPRFVYSVQCAKLQKINNACKVVDYDFGCVTTTPPP